MKTNTSKRRQLSLFNQGVHLYDEIPNMRADRLEMLMIAYEKEVRAHAIFGAIFGLI